MGARVLGTRSAFDWREVEDGSAPGGLGRHCWATRWAADKVFVLSYFFLVLFCFLFCRFVLNLVLKPIQFFCF